MSTGKCRPSSAGEAVIVRSVPREPQDPPVLLTFSQSPSQGFPLPPQQATQPIPQTTQQVLGQAQAELGFWTGPPFLLGASGQVVLLLLLLSHR